MRLFACPAVGLLAILAAIPAVHSQEQLLTNPGFEAVDPNGVPSNWSRYGGGAPESRLSTETGGRNGTLAARMVDEGPEIRDGRYAIGLYQDVPVEPGKLYVASVWANCIARNNGAAVILQLNFEPSKTIALRHIAGPMDGAWRRYTLASVAPEGTTTARLYIYTTHYWTSDTLVDDASLTALDADGMGFETALLAFGMDPLTGPRPLNLATPITRDGQPTCIISAPDQPEYAELARMLADGIREKTGVLPPVVPDLRDLPADDRTIIAIGNLNNNFVIERLYFNRYTGADSLWPGKGAFALRTVHQPFNFGQGANVITVEASDLEGARRGVTALLERVPEGPSAELAEPLVYVSSSPTLDEAAQRAIVDRAVDKNLWLNFSRACEEYRDSGQMAYARLAKRIMGMCIQRYQADPQYRVTWPEETNSNLIGSMWDAIEEAPVWTDEERLDAENCLLLALCGLPRHVSDWGSLPDNDTIIWNHTTFPLMGIYWLARYFERYHPGHSELFADHLAHVSGAFRGQVKSHKPQCDADGYQTIAPRHTIEFTLAENDYTYFENGNARRFAELSTGMCDNRGVVAGFGDSAYTSTPGYERNALPMALWYYRDGRYLWRMNQIYESRWANPYHQDVEPVDWSELVGMTVWPMAPEFYRWASEHSSYSEPPSPPNVPLEKAFDKITFREDLEPDGQYLLLDGFARGKHLHYDGNAITKYYANGQDWLIDGDYLVRNTTDHTMISVIRDGRCAELMPSAVGLEHHADLGRYALSQTTVTGFNGADWARNLLWIKGGPFVLIDLLAASEPAHFVFESVFKLLDDGELTVEGARSLSCVRPLAGGVGSRDLEFVRDPAPGVEKAVRFTTQQSRLEFPLTLAAGSYAVTMHASGTSTGSDSLFMSVDGSANVGFHTPVNGFDASSSAPSKSAPTPSIVVPAGGQHIITITLREAPGVLLDRIEFLPASGGEAITVVAADAPKIPDDQAQEAPAARFFIRTDGAADFGTSTRVNHVGLDLVYFRGRFGGPMQAGEEASTQAIFYDDRSDAQQEWDLRRTGNASCVILRDGSPWGIFSARPGAIASGGSLVSDAAMALVARGSLVLVDATRLGDMRASAPVSVELDFAARAATFSAAKSTYLAGAGAAPLAIPAGSSTVDMDEWEGLAALHGEIDRILREFGVPELPSRVGGQQEAETAWPELWRADFGGDESTAGGIHCLLPADISGDGEEELLVAAGRSCVCIDASGRTMWQIETDGDVNDIAVGDLNGDGAPEILIASEDECVYAVDALGRKLSRTKVDVELRVGTSSVRAPRVANVAIGDLEGDGQADVLVGTRNGNVARYTADMNRIWSFDRIEHGTHGMRLVDVDGDGILEVIAANRYGAVEVVSAAGTALPGNYSELGDVVFDLADLDADGRYEVVNGSSTGACVCSRLGGPPIYHFDNFGYGVTDVLIADLGGGGELDTIVASETGYVYLLDPAGETKASRRLSDAVLSLASASRDAGGRLLAAGCRDGSVRILDGELTTLARASVGAPAHLLAGVSATGGASRIAVASGAVVTLLDAPR